MEITVPKNGITGLFDKLSERIFQEDNGSTRHGPFRARFNKRILGQLRNIVYQGLLSKEKYIDFKKPLGEQEREFTVKERFCILSYELRAKGLTNKADKLNKMLTKLDFPCARSAFTGDLNVVHEVEAVLKLLLILSNNEALMTPDVCEVWRKVHSSFQFLNAAQNDLPSFHSNNEKDSHHDHVNLDYQIYPREIFEVEPSFGIPKKGFGKEDISLQVDLFSQEPGTLCGLFEWFGAQSNKDVFMKKTRTSLYDALIHSQTNDLEVKLSLPDLPCHPSFNVRPLASTKILKKNDFETFNGCQLYRRDIVSDDSGVYDLNIWDEALKTKPSCFHTWEGRKQIISQNCKPFLTEAGAEVVNYLHDIRINEACFLINSQPPSYKYLQVTELIRDGLMVLIGVPSQTFRLEKSTSSFVVSSTVRLSGCSPDSLQYSLNNLAELGTNYLRLDKFTNCQKQSTLIKSSVLRAFITGLRKYFQKYRQIVILVTDSHVQSVLDLCTKFRKQAYELRFLSDICMCPQGFAGEFGKPKPKFPVGVKLLSYLYQLCLINASSPIANLLLFLLKVSCTPYLRFIKQWMFKGRCIDVYKEFMISESDVYLASRDKYYWTNGYIMSSTTKMEGVPVFLKDLAEDMFTCGKSINLLKLCFPDHYICNHQVNVPVLSVTYSLDSLKVVCDSSRRYYEEMKELEEQKNLDWRRKKVEEKSRREQVLIDERHKASKALAEVQELVKKAKQALAEKKKEELDFLKQQMEDALNKKILDVKEGDEEDARVAKNSLLYQVTTAKLEEKLKQETRDELIQYYEELTREAERREKRAIWLTRRHALNNERQTFFEEEVEKLREMRKELNDELEKDKRLKSIKINQASSVPRKQWTFNNQESNTIIPDEVDGVPVQHPSQSTVQDLIYNISDARHSQSRLADETSSQSLEKVTEVPVRHPTESTEQNLMYPSTADQDMIRHPSSFVSQEKTNNDRHLNFSTPEDTFTTSYQRTSEPLSTIQHLMYGGNDKSSGTTRGHEPSSTIQHLMYPDSDDKSSGTATLTRGNEPVSTIQHLMYPDSDDKSSGTANLTRGSEPVSTIQHLMYPDSDDKSSGTANLTRGNEPSSTIQLYRNSDDKSSGTANLTRGHAAVSTIQDLMYPASDNTVSTISSTRGSAPASTIESLLYPENVNVKSRITSSRGSEPASTIQNFLYPSSIGRVLESEKIKREPLTHEDVWLATQFEPLPDNFDILDEEPCGDIFARVFQKGLGGNGDVDGSETEIGNIEIENDACKVFCLPVILQRCVMEPLITQINVVNSAIVRYFLDDLKLIEHFETLKKFLLMEDGEFSLSLTQQLFERVSCGVTPQQLCCISTLNSIMAHAIQSSVYACQSENTRSLSFVLKSLPDIFKRNDVGVFDFIELRYKIRWPANIVITENCITKYNRIFAFMLRLKRTAWVLQDIRTSLKRMDKHSYNSPQLRKVHLFRHEMSHFVNDVQGYISNQILHVTWQEFLQSLEQNVRNLDDLHDCHAEYLNKALFRALLNKKAAPVMKIISDLFTMVLKFHTQLVSSSWQTDHVSGDFVHPRFSLLCSTHDTFKESTCFLFTVISKLVTRGYQPHLEELLLRLDFNSYYGKNISGNPLAINTSEV